MRRIDASLAIGFLLVAVGTMLLLQNLNLIAGGLDLIWALIFILGGVAFLVGFAGNRSQWGLLIPGFVLLAIGGLIGLDRVAPGLGEWGGAFFLAVVGLAFWAIYFVRRESWWPVIPGGALLTIALMVAVSETASDLLPLAVLFLGLGLTFGLLYFLPRAEGRMTWAGIPAIVLLVLGGVTFAAEVSIVGYLGPAALIVGGLYLVYRTMRSR